MNQALHTCQLRDLQARLGQWGSGFCFADEADQALPCRVIAEPTWLRQRVCELAESLGTADLRAAASLWAKYYHSAVVRAALPAMAIERVGIDTSLENSGMTMEAGYARCLCIDARRPPLSASNDDLRRSVFAMVIDNHLEPFIRAMAEAASLPHGILWSDLAMRCEYMFSLLLQEITDVNHAAVIAQDRDMLLRRGARAWSGKRNPLHNALRTDGADSEGRPRVVRRACCLAYRLPTAKYCGTCPLEHGSCATARDGQS